MFGSINKTKVTETGSPLSQALDTVSSKFIISGSCMNIDHLKKKSSNETVCRQFLESVIWKDGRHCSHCGHAKSCRLDGAHLRAGVYECYRCKRQFTVTTKTPLHS